LPEFVLARELNTAQARKSGLEQFGFARPGATELRRLSELADEAFYVPGFEMNAKNGIASRGRRHDPAHILRKRVCGIEPVTRGILGCEVLVEILERPASHAGGAQPGEEKMRP
jgi:hypothetical protein